MSTRAWRLKAAMPISNPSPQVIKTKLLSHARAMDAASGDVSYTGYGFKPNALIIVASKTSGTWFSVGLGDKFLAENCLYWFEPAGIVSSVSTVIIIGLFSFGTGEGQSAVVKTLDSDGFTLTWTKVGTPAAGNANFAVLAF